jgi:hypothetical protein
MTDNIYIPEYEYLSAGVTRFPVLPSSDVSVCVFTCSFGDHMHNK